MPAPYRHTTRRVSTRVGRQGVTTTMRSEPPVPKDDVPVPERQPEPRDAADPGAQATYFRAGDVAASASPPLAYVWTLGHGRTPPTSLRPVLIPWRGELCRGPQCHAGIHRLHRRDDRAGRIALNRAPLEAVGAPFERADCWVSDEDALAHQVSQSVAAAAIAAGMPVYRSHQCLFPAHDPWTTRQPEEGDADGASSV